MIVRVGAVETWPPDIVCGEQVLLLVSDRETFESKLDPVIDRALIEQRLVGTVVHVLREGQPVYNRAAGFADREARIPMRGDGIFRLASLTKPMVAAAAMAAVEQGYLQLDQYVTKWLPEFRTSLPDGSRAEITLAQLLNHTAGLAYGLLEPEDGPYHRANVSDGLDQPGLSLEENFKRIASAPLVYRPGTQWSYSVASDVAAAVVARAVGGSIPQAVTRFVTGPLAMQDTGFTVSDPSRLVVPYADGAEGPVRMGELQRVKNAYGPGYILFAPARVWNPDSYASGGCGMVGTARDFARFLEALRTGGAPILSATGVRAMTSNQTGVLGPRPGFAFGFGLSVLTDPAAAQTPQSVGTFAWGGVYGHSWFVDPVKILTVVILTNSAIEGMAGQFPYQIRDAVYAAL